MLILILCTTSSSSGQIPACSVTTVGYTPINVLGTGTFRGFQGGLYPGGSNTRPVIHNNNGVTISHNILPLDTAGNYDPVNGKIVLMSVGMSNTNMEFAKFMSFVASATNINPKLVVVNGAQGTKDINKIINPLDSFWIVIGQKLAFQNVTAKQVQAIWYKEAEAGPTDTSFVTYSNGLKVKYKTVMNILKTKFKNVKLCYSSSRIYAGYASTLTNPEPYAYYNGWTVKWMIEDQINGDTSLNYTGALANSPWLSWGPYVWTDGTTPGADGLTWICPDDYLGDGTHPSDSGVVKVATRLLNFFYTDATTKPWFTKNLTLHLTLGIQALLNISTGVSNIKDTVLVNVRQSAAPFNVVDAYVAVIDSVSLKGIYKFYNLTNGRYYFQIIHRNSIETWSRSVGENLISGSISNYDFTTGFSKAYGNNLVQTGNKFCIYSGDINKDGLIDLNDVIIAFNDASSFKTGYVNSDLNGDGLTDLIDVVMTYNNSSSFITKVTP